MKNKKSYVIQVERQYYIFSTKHNYCRDTAKTLQEAKEKVRLLEKKDSEFNAWRKATRK